MALASRGFRPLDWVRSIKVKLGLVVLGTVAATVGAIYLSVSLGVHARFAFIGGLIFSLAVIQLLAHGMVLPLRQMVAATRSMANGDYSQRVTATAKDEVGSLARSFNAMAARLEETELQRRELVANVSHELRTPIAALRARLENLADGVETLDAAAVPAMLMAIERLSKLVNQLLELSQFESGAIRLDRHDFPAAEVVAAAMAEISPVGLDVRIVAELSDGLTVTGDLERIHEVLTNLLSNAVRHSPPGTEVRIRGAPSDRGARFEVNDEGSGIPPGEVERIFDRFYRVDAARASESGGAGLGLAIARSIVDLHGGTIRAESRLPAGFSVIFEIPS